MGGRDSEVDSVDGGKSEVDGGGEVRLYHDKSDKVQNEYPSESSIVLQHAHSM